MAQDDRQEMSWARQAVVLASLAIVSLTVAPARAAVTVEQWGVYEIEMKGPTDGNPFIDVRFSAVFTNGSRSVEVAGFYDGDGVYRVRFMPEQTGVWRYETRSNRWPLSRRTGSFTATAPKGVNHGPVRVRNTYHFAYADGTTFRPFGTTCYNWLQAPEEINGQPENQRQAQRGGNVWIAATFGVFAVRDGATAQKAADFDYLRVSHPGLSTVRARCE